MAREVERLGTRTLFIGGALTQEFVDDFTRVLPPRRELRVVVRDATVLVLPATSVQRCRKRGIALEVLTPLRVLAVTANPFRVPQPYQPKVFFDAVAGVQWATACRSSTSSTAAPHCPARYALIRRGLSLTNERG